MATDDPAAEAHIAGKRKRIFGEFLKDYADKRANRRDSAGAPAPLAPEPHLEAETAYYKTKRLNDDEVMRYKLPAKDINLPVESKPLRAGRSMRRR